MSKEKEYPTKFEKVCLVVAILTIILYYFTT